MYLLFNYQKGDLSEQRNLLTRPDFPNREGHAYTY